MLDESYKELYESYRKLYELQKNENESIYYFKRIPLKIKVYDDGNFKNVFVNYNGYNPTMSMLFGNFEGECDLYGDFGNNCNPPLFNIDATKYDGSSKNVNALFFVIDKNIEEKFIMVVYDFVMYILLKDYFSDIELIDKKSLDDRFSKNGKSVWDF